MVLWKLLDRYYCLILKLRLLEFVNLRLCGFFSLFLFILILLNFIILHCAVFVTKLLFNMGLGQFFHMGLGVLRRVRNRALHVKSPPLVLEIGENTRVNTYVVSSTRSLIRSYFISTLRHWNLYIPVLDLWTSSIIRWIKSCGYFIWDVQTIRRHAGPFTQLA